MHAVAPQFYGFSIFGNIWQGIVNFFSTFVNNPASTTSTISTAIPTTITTIQQTTAITTTIATTTTIPQTISVIINQSQNFTNNTYKIKNYSLTLSVTPIVEWGLARACNLNTSQVSSMGVALSNYAFSSLLPVNMPTYNPHTGMYVTLTNIRGGYITSLPSQATPWNSQVNYSQAYGICGTQALSSSGFSSTSQYPRGAVVTLSNGLNLTLMGNSTSVSFTGWTCSGNGCYSGTQHSINITINNNITETANYEIKQIIVPVTTTIPACSNSFSVPCSINGSIIVRTSVNTTVPVIVGGNYLSALTHT